MSMTHDEMIAVIQAHKEGKQLQYRSIHNPGDWRDVLANAASWQFSDVEYRVKREPSVLYMLRNRNGGSIATAWGFTNPADAAKHCPPDHEVVRFVEELTE